MSADIGRVFQPLEDRLAGKSPDGLQVGVPDHLEGALREWLEDALMAPGKGSGGRFWTYRSEICRRAALRLQLLPVANDEDFDPVKLTDRSVRPRLRPEGLSYATAILDAPGKHLHEVVDAVLFSWDDACGPPPVESLDMILMDAGSAYRVDDGRRQLVLRVDPTVEAAFRVAVSGAGEQPGEYLRRAWQHAYGLRPDPTAAYREAVRAVEEAFVPLVSPTNTRASLGTVCRDLTNQQGVWELVLVDNQDIPGGINHFVGLLDQLWRGQRSRHGGGNSRDQTQAEAEAAVHLAALAMHWLSTAVLRKKP